MIKAIVFCLFFTTYCSGQFEVIPISSELSDKTLARLWPALKGGAIFVNNNEVIIPDQYKLFLQRRSPPFDYTNIDLRRNKAESFKVYKVTSNNDRYAYSVLGSDYYVYLFTREIHTGETYGPVLRHGIASERLFLLDDNRLVATGAYRPELMGYLKKYMKGTLEDQKKNAKEKYDPLFLNHKAYTLSVYDKKLHEIDSGNVINKIGDNARAYEGLYLSHAVDITQENTIFLIDNGQGYVIEKYTDITCYDSSFRVANANYIDLPRMMSMADMFDLRSKDKAYSVPYGLYEKDGYLLSCFFQAPVYFQKIKPPYYYDISTTSGELRHSGSLEYPILCEDDADKVFFYVSWEGGWFEDDHHFLVGVTVNDFLSGVVSGESIDNSIERFINSE